MRAGQHRIAQRGDVLHRAVVQHARQRLAAMVGNVQKMRLHVDLILCVLFA